MDPTAPCLKSRLLWIAIAAVVPAIIVALFFGVLVTRGVEQWFSQRVRTVVENAATVARAYVDEQTSNIQSQIVPMADDLDLALPSVKERIVSSESAARWKINTELYL